MNRCDTRSAANEMCTVLVQVPGREFLLLYSNFAEGAPKLLCARVPRVVLSTVATTGVGTVGGGTQKQCRKQILDGNSCLVKFLKTKPTTR